MCVLSQPQRSQRQTPTVWRTTLLAIYIIPLRAQTIGRSRRGVCFALFYQHIFVVCAPIAVIDECSRRVPRALLVLATSRAAGWRAKIFGKRSNDAQLQMRYLIEMSSETFEDFN